MTPETKTAYRYHRQQGATASFALHLAKADAFKHVTRYPTAVGNGRYNAPFNLSKYTTARWIESPARAGLRFVGYCDKLARIDHTGWYGDEFGDAIYRGVVFQLPARNGRAQYVAGYQDPHNGKADQGGPCAISFDSIFEGETGIDCSYSAENDLAARDAARCADGLAEMIAESEREYQHVWDKGNEYRELGESIAETRKETLELCEELRDARNDIGDRYPSLCASLVGTIKANWRDMNRDKKRRAELFARYGNRDGFTD